jgi:hypothetical protein
MNNKKKWGFLVSIIVLLTFIILNFNSATLEILTTSNSSTNFTAWNGIDYLAGTPANGSFINRSWIEINVTSNLSAFRNLTIRLYNSTEGLNYTQNHTSPTVLFNISNFTDGLWYFNVTSINTSGFTNYTATRSITIDLTYPALLNGSGTDVNASTVNRSWIYFNVSIIETNPSNITFLLYNSSGEFNRTTFTLSNITRDNRINWSRVPNGNYTYNATINDLAGNINTTTIRKITIADTTAPQIGLVSPAYEVTSTTSSYNFTFNITDEGDILNCSLIIDGVEAQVMYNPVRGANIGMYNGSFSVATHNWSVNCTDIGGNQGNSTLYKFYVTGGVGGSGGNSASGPVFWLNTYVPLDSEFISEKGYTKELSSKNQIRIKIGNEDHNVGVIIITSTTATINVSSTPQQAVFNIGDEKKFDVNSDNYYDLFVKLNSIANNKANVTIKKIYEEISSVAPVLSPDNESGNETNEIDDIKTENNHLWKWILVIVIVIIIIVVAYYIFWNKKKY